jgi:Arc/MetJ family transcription regulator
MSRTNIVLDDELVKQCQNVTGIKTKKGLIDFALKELLRYSMQRKLLELKGNVDWDGDLDEWRKGVLADDISGYDSLD